jgi:DNA primase
MIPISPSKFVAWAENHFDSVIITGDEVKLNSIFTDDKNHKLWCNVKGGKKGQPPCFQCWKTGKKGSLISLVMMVQGCTFQEALSELGGENSIIRNLELQFEEFWANKNKEKPKKQIKRVIEQDEEETEPEFKYISLPPQTYSITDLPNNNYYRVQSEVYLFNRKMPCEGLYVCTAGNYRNRIIIPYYDATGNLIYFNSRYIGTNELALRYMGPEKTCGVGKEDVLYVPKWPVPDKKIYLTEGEFDALSIYICGKERDVEIYSGAFGGKNLSEKQIEMIRQYQPVLCLDTDPGGIDYGKEGLIKMGLDLRAKGLRPRFVRPPKAYKDWNKMLCETSPGIVLHYLKAYEKPLNDANLMKLQG